MNLTEFAQSHNIEMQVISKHIKAHADEYQGKIKENGKSKELTDEAIEILEKYYPIPKPVQVINGVPEEEHRKKLEELESVQKDLLTAKDLIISLKDQLTDYQLKLKDTENEQLRIEEKAKIKDVIISKHEASIKELEESAEQQKKISAEQELKLSDLQSENEKLKAELEAEKNKSWWDKLRGK